MAQNRTDPNDQTFSRFFWKNKILLFILWETIVNIYTFKLLYENTNIYDYFDIERKCWGRVWGVTVEYENATNGFKLYIGEMNTTPPSLTRVVYFGMFLICFFIAIAIGNYVYWIENVEVRGWRWWRCWGKKQQRKNEVSKIWCCCVMAGLFKWWSLTVGGISYNS